MLQRINGRPSRACQLLRDAAPSALFPRTLEFSPPARGTWNIVHTGMLVPESHQIYVCASGCLRGVVLTAAEMGLSERFSTIELLEKDLLRSDNEELIITGVTDILDHLPHLPRVVLLFTACFHHFMGINLNYVYKNLRERFPQVDFAECIMDPIRQSKSLTPEERERREIYRLWRKLPLKPKHANIIAGNLPLDSSSEIMQLLMQANYTIHDMPRQTHYDDFIAMAASSLNIYTNPFGHKAAMDLQRRNGQDYLFLPQLWCYADITTALGRLAEYLGLPTPDYTSAIAECESALADLHTLIGATPIAIDCTVTFAPFSLARLLVTHGFNVRRIYSDVVSPDDRDSFHYLRQNHGTIELWATKNPDERVLARNSGEKILCLGQKAAYFNDTPYFIEFVDGGGHYGFDGIKKLVAAMREGFLTPKDTRKIISRKANGGPCCYEA